MKADTIRWHQFSRRGDAVFLSLGHEIVILTLSVATLLLAAPQTAQAQTVTRVQAETSSPEEVLDEVEVTASRLPLSMQQTARIVNVLTRTQIENCPAQSVNDLLKYAASVDVRQRGGFGIQTDISINGGTHDQIVILLNGVYFSSPQTGHHSSDFPISIDDIERIEVLEGAASRVYGTSAFSGAINIVTRSHASGEQGNVARGSVGIQGGSFGTFGANGTIGFGTSDVSHQVSSGWTQTDGGTPNSDARKFRAFYQGDHRGASADLHWQMGVSRMDYGANTFYSGKYPNQYEENRRYTASVGAKTKGNVVFAPLLYFSRALDHYQLIKDTPTGENFHMTDIYGFSLNAYTDWALGTTSVGADLRNEGILSTSLGHVLADGQQVKVPGFAQHYTRRDNRTNVCYFLEHDIVLSQWTISVGAMANMNTGLDYRYRLYPGIDIGYRPSASWKFYASWNMAQRMPTFTDLYYQSPTQAGNVGLKPEKTSEFAVGGKWRTRGVDAELRLFHRHNRSMIDWVMTAADSVNGYTTYHAANFELNNMGGSLNATLLFRELFGEKAYLNRFSAQYSYLYQKRNDGKEIYASSYALDYLRHKVVLRLDTKIYDRLSATLSFRWQQRMGEYIRYTPVSDGDGGVTYEAAKSAYHPYGLLDLRLQWVASRYDLYVEGNNLTDHRYYDIGNVRQPGFWLMAGGKWKF